MQQGEPWHRTPVGRGTILMTITAFAFGFAMSANQNIVSNFFEHSLGLSGPQFGYITAVREIPGFLLIFLTALFYRVPLPKLTAGALLLLATGYFFFGTATSFWTVAPWVILSSMGYHTFLQTKTALSMSLVSEGHSGAILGRIAAVGSAGALGAMLVVMLGFQFNWLGFNSTFILAGVMALVAAVAIVGFPNLRDGQAQAAATRRDPLVLSKDYRFYYLLSLLDGGRQQIFFSFGLWVLVHQYGLGVPAISGIMLATTALSMVTGPRIGRLIDRRGERRILGWVNLAYIAALLGYGLIDNVVVAVLCYVTYSFIFPISDIGASTYLRKIAVYREVAPSLAMGVTMQHAAAVIVPIATGFVLNFVGYQLPFIVAACFASLTILVTRELRPEAQKSPRRLAEEAQAAEAAADAAVAPAAPSLARPGAAAAGGGN